MSDDVLESVRATVQESLLPQVKICAARLETWNTGQRIRGASLSSGCVISRAAMITASRAQGSC